MNRQTDLLILGGGVMGLCTAYYASHYTDNIILLERDIIGNKHAASTGYTRTIRNDYLDPFYARLAYEARELWQDLEAQSNTQLIINCGCINLAKKSITPDLSRTYAQQSYETMTRIGIKARLLDRQDMKREFPQIDADLGCLELEGGFLSLHAVTRTLRAELLRRNVQIVEHAETLAIEPEANGTRVVTKRGNFATKNLVITVGAWVNDALKLLGENAIQFPIELSKPSWNYYAPPQDKRGLFLSSRLPAFGYLDVGVWGHPIYDGVTPGVKVGWYDPTDGTGASSLPITSAEEFIRECFPDFAEIETVDAPLMEECLNDAVADDNFIVGALPNHANIFIGAGWLGTGYKFGPVVGKILAQLSMQQGTIYDIARFAPSRFSAHRTGQDSVIATDALAQGAWGAYGATRVTAERVIDDSES